MPIALALPEFLGASTPAPDARPPAIGRWLGQLRGELPEDVAQAMAERLFALNRTALSPRPRREIADLFFARASTLWPALEGGLRAFAQPLSGEALASTKATIALASEINIAYKRCLADELARKSWARGGRQLPELIHLCQIAAGRVLSVCYVAHAPVPEGTWHDLHAIYLLALERDLATTAVNPHVAFLTPERAYVQTLLLALANPYGLLPGQLPLVVEFIGEHCHLATLGAEPPVHRTTRAVAVVPAGYDFPPYAANKGGAAGESPLYLRMHELAFRLQEALHRVERGEAMPAAAGAGPGARVGYVAMLRRLLREWGATPARHFNRLPGRSEVAVCAGLNLVWQVTRAVRAQQATAGEISTLLLPGRVLNQTPGGLALKVSRQATAGLAIRVGELLGIQNKARDRWLVACVRWFRNTLRDNGVEVGCEVLAEDFEVAAVRDERSPESQRVHALYLAGDALSAPSLIVPQGALEAESGAVLRTSRHTGTIVLTKLTEHAAGFDRFEFVAVG